MVLTEKGQLCFEPDDATHIHTPSGKKTILAFDMVNVVKHETVEIACLGGWAMELVFRTSAGKPSGLRWTKVKRRGSKGKELIHPQLAAALRKKTEFTQEEWDEFEITDLAEDDALLRIPFDGLLCRGGDRTMTSVGPCCCEPDSVGSTSNNQDWP